jgi:protein-S-isoprenylcysteine O-methyltransferase Ste14
MPSRLRVVSGYVVGLLVFALARPTTRSLLAGVPFLLLGEALRLWASGHIQKTQELATGGPYAHTRNPLYLGSVFLALGVAVACASPAAAALVLVYFAAFYPSVIREESAFLQAKFQGDYDAWAREVPAFWPRLTPGGPRRSRFAWEIVARNREWKTAAALPLLALLLWTRRLLADF